MKKQIVRGIVVLLSLAFLALPALSAVSVSPNEKGDLMFFPVYYAMEGIETNINIINTSDTDCVVAKVIVRSHKYSIEVLDFLIYLTPNDVFKATLKYEGGKYILVSTDDSLCVGTSASNMMCASEDHPIALELYDPTFSCDCASADDQSWGYIDTIEATSHLMAKGEDGTVKKKDLYTWYLGLDATNTVFDPEDTINSLTGWAELVFPGSEYSIFKPTVLKDYDNVHVLNVGDADPKLANPNDVEAALSKNKLAVPYYNKDNAFTLAWLTFPTKQSVCPTDADCTWGVRGCYFETDHAGFAPDYSVELYDMSEHTITTGCLRSPCPETQIEKLPDEVNVIYDWLGSANPFTEGWGRVSLESLAANTCFTDCDGTISYAGSPVIGLVGEITPEGLSLMAPAYDFGTIYTGDASNVTGCFQLGCVPCGGN